MLFALDVDLESGMIALDTCIGATGSEGAVMVWVPVKLCKYLVMWSLNVVNSEMLALKR